MGKDNCEADKGISEMLTETKFTLLRIPLN